MCFVFPEIYFKCVTVILGKFLKYAGYVAGQLRNLRFIAENTENLRCVVGIRVEYLRCVAGKSGIRG